MKTQYTPIDIAVDIKKGEVRIEWQDRHKSVFSLDFLRDNCPCAVCDEERRKAQEEPLFIRATPKGKLLVDKPAELVGQYAIQFFWADGHNSGIYSYDYLRELDDSSGD